MSFLMCCSESCLYQLMARQPSCPHIPMMNLPREVWSPSGHLHLFWVISPWVCVLATVFIWALFVGSWFWLLFQFPLLTLLFMFAFENPVDLELSYDQASGHLMFLGKKVVSSTLCSRSTRTLEKQLWNRNAKCHNIVFQLKVL